MPNKEFPRGSRDVQALHEIPEGADWNVDSSHPWNVNRIVRTRTGWAPAGLGDSDVAVFPGPIVPVAGCFQPFAYGFGFLLLLWGCMAWEKWIGWVI